MKKRNVLALLLTATMTLGTLSVAGCGEQELALTTERVEIELGSELDTAVTTYVADEKVAADATVDFSAVDTSAVGTYTVPVTYNEQTASFEVEVVDTTAPVVECVDSVTVPVNTPVCAEDMIASVTELSGNVEVTIAEPVAVAMDEDTETEDADSEDVAAEESEATEEAEATEAVVDESTETVESAESTESTEQAAEIVLEPFTVDNVLCNNDYVILTETGEYDAAVTVADMSGNTTEATVHIVVGEAPTISGVEDITVTVGADEVDYLDGVTAVDCNGNDITDKIICDSSIVDIETVGEYGIVYTVVDENGFEAHATALVAVKEKSSGRTGSTSSTSSTSSSSSKPGSATTSSASSTASSTTSTSTSTQSQSSQTTYSQDTSSSYDTSSQNNQTATQTPSVDTTTSSNTSSTDTSAQTPSTDTTTSTPSTDTSAQTPSTDTSTSTDGGMSVPDSFIQGDMSLMDNTGTGCTGGDAGGVIEGGNF